MMFSNKNYCRQLVGFCKTYAMLNAMSEINSEYEHEPEAAFGCELQFSIICPEIVGLCMRNINDPRMLPVYHAPRNWESSTIVDEANDYPCVTTRFYHTVQFSRESFLTMLLEGCGAVYDWKKRFNITGDIDHSSSIAYHDSAGNRLVVEDVTQVTSLIFRTYVTFGKVVDDLGSY